MPLIYEDESNPPPDDAEMAKWFEVTEAMRVPGVHVAGDARQAYAEALRMCSNPVERDFQEGRLEGLGRGGRGPRSSTCFRTSMVCGVVKAHVAGLRVGRQSRLVPDRFEQAM